MQRPEDRPSRPEALFDLHPRVREVSRVGDLWVLDKPPRVLSHPNPPARVARNAILRVQYDIKREAYSAGDAATGERHEAYLVHRLDRETSGLILLAFRGELAASLKELFYRREVGKQYRALVRGVIRERHGVWRDALSKTRAGGKVRVEVVRGRANAETRFRVLERYPRLGLTLVALEPETGRTHQLRVQSASRGHPIAGDERYGDFAWNRELRERIGLRRMALHAERIELRHPATGRRLEFVAPPDRSLSEPLGRVQSNSR